MSQKKISAILAARPSHWSYAHEGLVFSSLFMADACEPDLRAQVLVETNILDTRTAHERPKKAFGVEFTISMWILLFSFG